MTADPGTVPGQISGESGQGRRWPWLLTLVVPMVIVLQIFYFKPFFTQMEDAKRLSVVRENNLLETFRVFAFEYFGESYGHLGAQALSTLWAWFPYEFGSRFGSEVYFAVNVVAVFSSAFLLMVVAMDRPRAVLAIAGLSAMYLWPPFIDYFFFPSMEEKGVLLATTILVAWWKYTPKIDPKWYPLATVGVVALSSLTKPQIVAVMAGLVVASLVQALRKTNLQQYLIYAALLVLSSLYIVIRTFLGGYSSDQRNADVLANLQNRFTLLMAATAILCLFLTLIIYRNRLIPSLLLGALSAQFVFVLLVILFGTRSFWMAPYGGVFGVACLLLVAGLTSWKVKWVVAVVLLILSVIFSIWRIPQVFVPLHGIGAFTQGEIVPLLVADGAVVEVTCMEGADLFPDYARSKWGVSPEFRVFGAVPEAEQAGDVGPVYVLGDDRLCPLPVSVDRAEARWSSGGDNGFFLVRSR